MHISLLLKGVVGALLFLTICCNNCFFPLASPFTPTYSAHTHQWVCIITGVVNQSFVKHRECMFHVTFWTFFLFMCALEMTAQLCHFPQIGHKLVPRFFLKSNEVTHATFFQERTIRYVTNCKISIAWKVANFKHTKYLYNFDLILIWQYLTTEILKQWFWQK